MFDHFEDERARTKQLVTAKTSSSEPPVAESKRSIEKERAITIEEMKERNRAERFVNVVAIFVRK